MIADDTVAMAVHAAGVSNVDDCCRAADLINKKDWTDPFENN